MSEQIENYQALVKQLVLNESTFVRLTLKGQVRGPAVTWRQIIVRPVQLRSGRHLQFSYFDAKQDITKNFQGDEAEIKLDEVLVIPFSALQVETTEQILQVQVTKKGKAFVERRRVDGNLQQPSLTHNRTKKLPLPVGEPNQFLQQLGIMDERGNVKAQMQGKFGQINEFIKLVEHTGELERFDHAPINILDCGSGSAYLTFAIYHYLNEVRNIPANVVGIDVNQHVIEKSIATGTELRCQNIQFAHSAILDWQPEVQPDIVLALHACDTATDEAIAQGVGNGAKLVVCVPCCQHELHDQIEADVFKPVLRHGILKQRMADILTDSLRALALRIMGYKTDVIEFIDSEHTAKNLMIRAVKTTAPGEQSFIAEYNALKHFWKITPHIERLLGEQFTTLLNAPGSD